MLIRISSFILVLIFLIVPQVNARCIDSKKIKNEVIVVANLKNTGFNKVPINSLINDFFDKNSFEYNSIEYDSLTGNFKGIFYIQKAQLMLFFLKEVYVTPGDSVNITYKILKNSDDEYKDTMLISGKNASNYQYYTFFRNEYTYNNPDYPKYSLPLSKEQFEMYKRNLMKYYVKLHSRFLKSLRPFTYSLQYKNFAERNIFYYWISNFLTPSYNDEYQLLSENELLKLKTKLIKRMDTSSHSFYEAIMKLHKILSRSKESDYDISEFMRLNRDASSYPIFIKDFLLTNDIIEFVNHQRDSSHLLKMELIKACSKIVVRKYLVKVEPYKMSLINDEFKISNDILNINLVDENGIISKFGDILKMNRDKILYVDFWASWCIPCRKENASLKKVYNTFSTDSLHIIQISVDEDSNKWVEAVQTDKIYFSEKYRFVNKADYFKFSIDNQFTPIPYYLLLDKKGHLIVKNTPRPSDPQLSKILKHWLK
ncbi:MAG: TlpA family protein disulfide reductase [Bacteroidetes bacterium]|nr:TlpA family protein disulfide reductase [Bacteroidota bacterium]